MRLTGVHIVKRLLLALVAAFLLAPAPAMAAYQEPADAPGEQPAGQTVESSTVTMTVEVGLDGYVDPSVPVPVVVELTASALFVGRLELNLGGIVGTSVEVPAGSVKRYDSPPPHRGAADASR